LVFDTGSVANICNSMQELWVTRTLAKDEVTMHVGNRAKFAVIAVGTLPLHLPSGFILELSNCYFVPALLGKYAIVLLSQDWDLLLQQWRDILSVRSVL
jgi:hypothetical protein